MNPKISVIVPVYKAEKYLHRCVESILAQTITDFEILLIDDGSPDRSGEICDEYAKKDSRIKVFHKPNGGASDARNVGLDNAQGEYVCFVDSDDVVDKDFLEIFLQKDADIVVQGMYRNDITEDRRDLYVSIETGDFDLSNVTKFVDIICKSENIGYLVTRSFKRNIIEKENLRFDSRFRLREDMEFILRYMLLCKTFSTLNKGAYHYDVPSNFQKKYSNIDLESNILSTLSIIENFEKLSVMPVQLLTENVNAISNSLLILFRKERFNVRNFKRYLDQYNKYYQRCKGSTSLSKTSMFVFYFINPLYSIYDKVVCKKLFLYF